MTEEANISPSSDLGEGDATKPKARRFRFTMPLPPAITKMWPTTKSIATGRGSATQIGRDYKRAFTKRINKIKWETELHMQPIDYDVAVHVVFYLPKSHTGADLGGHQYVIQKLLNQSEVLATMSVVRKISSEYIHYSSHDWGQGGSCEIIITEIVDGMVWNNVPEGQLTGFVMLDDHTPPKYGFG